MIGPFLLPHDAGGVHIPLTIAEKLFDAVGSEQRTLKMFTREEGGMHHCQVDDARIGVHYIRAWIAGRAGRQRMRSIRWQHIAWMPRPIRCTGVFSTPR
jgi:hypothetical protein